MDTLLGYYPTSDENMSPEQRKQFDDLAEAVEQEQDDKRELLVNMITVLRSVPKEKGKKTPIVESVRSIILNNHDIDISVQEIARQVNISRYYLMHLFKEETGTTITAYKRELKISMAKKLLVSSTLTISEIASKCGFTNASYFAKVFLKSEHMLPSQYRELLKLS